MVQEQRSPPADASYSREFFLSLFFFLFFFLFLFSFLIASESPPPKKKPTLPVVHLRSSVIQRFSLLLHLHVLSRAKGVSSFFTAFSSTFQIAHIYSRVSSEAITAEPPPPRPTSPLASCSKTQRLSSPRGELVNLALLHFFFPLCQISPDRPPVSRMYATFLTPSSPPCDCDCSAKMGEKAKIQATQGTQPTLRGIPGETHTIGETETRAASTVQQPLKHGVTGGLFNAFLPLPPQCTP